MGPDIPLQRGHGLLGPRKEANDCLVAGPGTPADARLLAVLDELTQAREGQLYPRDGPPHEAFLLRRAPGGVTSSG